MSFELHKKFILPYDTTDIKGRGNERQKRNERLSRFLFQHLYSGIKINCQVSETNNG